VLFGTDEAISAWVDSGSRAVEELRQELAGDSSITVAVGTSQRDVVDNLSAASHALATAFPDEFLEAFDDPAWGDSGFVCVGLGAIRRPEVTERLMQMLTSDNVWIRMDAAVALRGYGHPALRATLVAAAGDPDYLVRYHVSERLTGLGEG